MNARQPKDYLLERVQELSNERFLALYGGGRETIAKIYQVKYDNNNVLMTIDCLAQLNPI